MKKLLHVRQTIYVFPGKNSDWKDAKKIRLDLERPGNLEHLSERRRLVALPDFQEPLGLPTIQPSDTTHAVDNGEPEGMSLGTLAAVPVATVLIGFMLVSSVRALLKRFRKQEKRRERTSFDDNG